MELKLQAIRKGAGLKQYEMAEKLGIDVRTYGAWERGENMINLAQAYECAIVLGCTIDEIAGRKPIKQSFTDARQEAMNRDYASLSEAGKAAAAGAVSGILAQEGRDRSLPASSPGEVDEEGAA